MSLQSLAFTNVDELYQQLNTPHTFGEGKMLERNPSATNAETLDQLFSSGDFLVQDADLFSLFPPESLQLAPTTGQRAWSNSDSDFDVPQMSLSSPLSNLAPSFFPQELPINLCGPKPTHPVAVAAAAAAAAIMRHQQQNHCEPQQTSLGIQSPTNIQSPAGISTFCPTPKSAEALTQLSDFVDGTRPSDAMVCGRESTHSQIEAMSNSYGDDCDEEEDEESESESESESDDGEDTMARDDEEYRGGKAKRGRSRKPASSRARGKAARAAHGGRDASEDGSSEEPRYVVSAPSSSKTVAFDMQSGRRIDVPLAMLEKRAKAFFQYFEKNFQPNKADVNAMKVLRRKLQLRKSSQKGRREQKIKNECILAELERLGSTRAADVLNIVRASVNRHVPAAARAHLLAEVSAALQDHFRTADSA
jgi:hypothetical protein